MFNWIGVLGQSRAHPASIGSRGLHHIKSPAVQATVMPACSLVSPHVPVAHYTPISRRAITHPCSLNHHLNHFKVACVCLCVCACVCVCVCFGNTIVSNTHTHTHTWEGGVSSGCVPLCKCLMWFVACAMSPLLSDHRLLE